MKHYQFFTSSVPASHLNNVKQNGFSTGQLRNATGAVYDADALLKRVSFVRNGTLSPYDYSIKTETSSTENTPRPVLITSLKEALNVAESTHTLVSPATENGLKTRTNVEGTEVYTLDPTISVEAQANPCVGYGNEF